MTERRYELLPRDMLFFRDGRPMDADKAQGENVRYIGHGAVWPRPDHLFNGVMHALLSETTDAGFGDFMSLKVMGPYPVKRDSSATDVLFLPRPLDWDMAIEPCADTDLPAPLEYGFIDITEGKKKLPAWVTASDFKKYLDGKDREMYHEIEKDKNGKTRTVVKFPYSDGNLFGTEVRVGTTLDAATGASKRMECPHASGQYQGEYLRLQKNVSMWCAVETGKIGKANDAPEAPEMPHAIVMGGQGGVVVRCDTDIDLARDFPAPIVADDRESFVRWTLIAPALFLQTGWLPGWCKDSRKDTADLQPLGTVMFPDCGDCKLVGACVGKPMSFSGWDQKDGAKPTVLAVPQGSAYLFRCKGKSASEALIRRLHLQRQSDFGPKGFGVGICSIVKPDIVKQLDSNNN